MHSGPPPHPHYPPGGPYGRNVPRYPGSKRSGCSCMKWCYCCFCCIFITLVAILTTFIVSWVIVNPKSPNYIIDGFDVNNFNLTSEMKLQADFIITVKADNPNKHLTLLYGNSDSNDDSIDVLFSGVKICSGKVPEFKQPTDNISMIKIEIKGDTKKDDMGGSVWDSLVEKLKSDKVPLLVAIKMPARIRIDKWEMPKPGIMVNVNCTMDVKNLAPGKKAEISNPKYALSFTIDNKDINPSAFF